MRATRVFLYLVTVILLIVLAGSIGCVNTEKDAGRQTGVEVHIKVVSDIGKYLHDNHEKYLIEGYQYIAKHDRDSSFFSSGKMKALSEFSDFFLKYYDSVKNSYKKQTNK